MPESPAAVMRQLHDEHAAALWAFCLHLTGNDRARAEDVAQETLLRAWRHAEVLQEHRGSVRAWLFTRPPPGAARPGRLRPRPDRRSPTARRGRGAEGNRQIGRA